MTEEANKPEVQPAYDDDYFFVLAAGFYLAENIEKPEQFSDDNDELVLWEPFEGEDVNQVYEYAGDLAETMKRIHDNAYQLGLKAGKESV